MTASAVKKVETETECEALMQMIKNEPAWKDYIRRLQQAIQRVQAGTVAIVQDPQFKTYTISTAGGAVTFGCVGGAFGMATGTVVGAGAGIIPALFTFGLSIPAGGVVGGGMGLCVGSGAGALGGGMAGFGGYKYRVEIKNGVVYVKRQALKAVELANTKVSGTVGAVSQQLATYSQATRTKVSFVIGTSKQYVETKTKTVTAFAKTHAVQIEVTSASAVAGGAAGAMAGGAVGTAAGIAVGIVPALFTFGLSIPICATMGLCAGTLAGGSTGAAGGGALGYVGYAHRKELGAGAQGAWQKACSSAEFVRTKASDSATQVKSSVKTLVGSDTGGTA